MNKKLNLQNPLENNNNLNIQKTTPIKEALKMKPKMNELDLRSEAYRGFPFIPESNKK